jgi:prefoldin beta subunit
MRGLITAERRPTYMQGNLPPEAEEKIEELRDLQQTAQEVAVQKGQAETELEEAQNAQAALEDLDGDTEMYREVGELLVETTFDDAEADIDSRISDLEVRVETLERQEGRVQERFEELQSELEELLEGAGGGGPMAGGPAGPGGPGA